MASKINAQIGLNVNKSSVDAVVNNVSTVKKQVQSVGPVFDSLQKKIESLGSVAKWAAIGAGAERVFGGIKRIVDSVSNSFKKQFDFAQSYASFGDRIAKTSRLVGMSVKDYQAFASAAKHAGMSTEEMDSALRKFSVNLGKARAGDRAASKMFDSILGGRKLSSFKDSTSLISAIADGYKKLNSAEQKAFVTNELFGRGGVKMAELLSGGGEGLQNALANFEGGFSEEGAKNAELFNDELQKTQEIIDSLKISAAQELFPVITEMFKSVQKFVKENRAELLPVVKDLVAHSVDFVKSLLPLTVKLLKSVLKIFDLIGPKVFIIVGGLVSMAPAVVQILSGLVMMAPILTKIGTVLKFIAFGAISAVVAKIAIAVAAAWSLYKVFTEIHKNWEMFSSFIEEKLQSAVGVSYTFWAALKSIVGQFEMAYRLIGVIFGGWSEWSKFVKKDLADVNAIVDIIGDCLAGLMYGLYEVFNFVVSKLEIFGGFIEKLPFVGKLIGLQKNLGAMLVDGGGGFSGPSIAASAVQAVSESRTTVTNRFAVDFNNVPRGTKITPPAKGDFDWSRGYMLGGI